LNRIFRVIGEAGAVLDDWIYSNSAWLSSGVFVLFGLFASAVVVMIMTKLIGPELRFGHNEFTSLTVANIAVLYTVLLAFIAVAAWEALAKASDIADSEAGLVEDLYVDAQGLNDLATRERLQYALQRYLETVIAVEWPAQQGGEVSRAASPALREFRLRLASFEPQTRGDSMVMQEMLSALNELYSARRSRLDAAGGHIPAAMWWVVILLGVLTIGFTGLLGMRRRLMHFVLAAGLTTAIVVVVSLIVQLDYPFRGAISVSADPYREVLMDTK
jgi:hypothetical protein